MDNYIGKKLDGRYEVLALIGEGGMANVYKGYDLKESRTIAIKILKDEFHDNEELVRRFKNESRAISVLNQQNIVKVYDISVNDKLQYIVMEYIDGITLKEYIEQRGEPLTYKETVLFISQVLRALQHAHDKGVVHRDIKPQNIMLTEDGTVKVMDFGIARLARSEIHTDGEQAIGSVHYISPEQAQGAATDPRADIYSTGIMMYEMLSGRLPFESDSAVSIAIKQISDEAVPLREVNPSAPEGLCNITAKAMAKDPKYRYQTALEMLRDIEEFKRDPSVKFEYEYLTNDDPTRYISKVAGNTNNKPAPKGKNGAKGKKRKKKHSILVPVMAGITLATVLVSAFLCYNIFAQSGNELFADLQEIELPNFVGMTRSEVEAALSKSPYKGIRLEIYEEYNDSLDANVVISQNPSSNGTLRVKENQKLYLTVNRGVELVNVPDVTGMDAKQATEALRDIGVQPYVMRVENSAVAAGQVFGTDPAIGTLVENISSTTVTIYVSYDTSKWSRTVPNLIGQESIEAAQKILEQNDLGMNMIRQVDSDQPEGTVLDQYPEPGVKVSKGRGISITVSGGLPPEEPQEEETVEVPHLIGMTPGEANGVANAVGFVIIYDHQYSDIVAEGLIMYQNPGSGSRVARNGIVSVTVSKGKDPTTTIPVIPPEPSVVEPPPVTPDPDPTPTPDPDPSVSSELPTP